MSGPGRPSDPGPAADLSEQVLVAAFPGTPPEVHVANLNPATGVLSFTEASVQENGEVSLGKKTTIAVNSIGGSVDLGEGGIVALIARNGDLLVQMHLETAEDQELWAEGLRGVIREDGGGPAAGGSGGDEVYMLKAKSSQLQTRIGDLEAVSNRRDNQLDKMLKRLDGAMQMLNAVQEMCQQQRKVVESQRVAIAELKLECGEESGEDDGVPATRSPAAARPPAAASAAPPRSARAAAPEEEEGEEEADPEVLGKAQEMLGLLQQAQEMQNALAALEAMGGAGGAGGPGGPGGLAGLEGLAGLGGLGGLGGIAELLGSLGLGGEGGDSDGSSRSSPQQAPRSLQRAAPAAAADNNKAVPAAAAGASAADQEEAQAVMERLHTLEAEKSRFEDMLQDSQQEHETLLTRLNDMRTLMSALGMQDPGIGEEDDA